MARVDLGLTRAEWLELTPRLLRAFVDHQVEGELIRERQLQLRAEYRAGEVCAAIFNAAPFSKSQRTFRPWDFFPDTAKLRRLPTDEELLEKVVAINEALGGEDLRDPDQVKH